MDTIGKAEMLHDKEKIDTIFKFYVIPGKLATAGISRN